MKKIMFNDKYGLTQAVLEGRKTMTRRIIKAPKTMEGQWVSGFAICKRPGCDEIVEVMALDEEGGMINNILPKYKPGEVVAVAQNYREVYEYLKQTYGSRSSITKDFYFEHVFGGRVMYVMAELMPHQIRITNVRVERLQDISAEDCIREGVYHQPFEQEDHDGITYWDSGYTFKGSRMIYHTSRDAFSVLIDKVSGKGTWESNPYVFVYEFELIK